MNNLGLASGLSGLTQGFQSGLQIGTTMRGIRKENEFEAVRKQAGELYQTTYQDQISKGIPDYEAKANALSTSADVMTKAGYTNEGLALQGHAMKLKEYGQVQGDRQTDKEVALGMAASRVPGLKPSEEPTVGLGGAIGAGLKYGAQAAVAPETQVGLKNLQEMTPEQRAAQTYYSKGNLKGGQAMEEAGLKKRATEQAIGIQAESQAMKKQEFEQDIERTNQVIEEGALKIKELQKQGKISNVELNQYAIASAGVASVNGKNPQAAQRILDELMPGYKYEYKGDTGVAVSPDGNVRIPLPTTSEQIKADPKAYGLIHDSKIINAEASAAKERNKAIENLGLDIASYETSLESEKEKSAPDMQRVLKLQKIIRDKNKKLSELQSVKEDEGYSLEDIDSAIEDVKQRIKKLESKQGVFLNRHDPNVPKLQDELSNLMKIKSSMQQSSLPSDNTQQIGMPQQGLVPVRSDYETLTGRPAGSSPAPNVSPQQIGLQQQAAAQAPMTAQPKRQLGVESGVKYVNQEPPAPQGTPRELIREDGSKKGSGWLGPLPMKDGKGYATELSRETDVDGGRILYPLLVPTLTKSEIDILLSGKKPTPEIERKAFAHAKAMKDQGKSAWAPESTQPQQSLTNQQSSANIPSFASIADAESAKLPKGTIVTIGGRKVIID